MEIIFMLAMLATGGSSNHNIESYCKASHQKLGAQSLCIQRNKSAQSKINNLPYPDKAILEYCKKVIGPPAWRDIRTCYKTQVPMKGKYEGLAKLRRDKAEACDENSELQNWIKKVNCIHPGGASYPSRDAYHMGLRDTFMNR